MTPRLITIPISHYCEKARWALDRAGIPFTEEAHLQVLHYRHVRRAGGGRSVPALITGDGAGTLGDSTDILKWADQQRPGALYPTDPALRRAVEELEDRFDERLGPPTRRVAYAHLLARADLAREYGTTGVPRLERMILRVAFPGMRLFLRRHFHIDEAAVASDLRAIRRVFDEVAALLAGRKFLVGDTFGAADLTFATLASPVLFPSPYGVPMPGLDELPDGLRAVVAEFRAHAAGQYALRLYETERIR
jgi:glutathione S-transferase